MNKFSYTGKANIKHLNIRKEGPDEEKTLTVDVKLECVASASLIDFFDDGLRPALYTDIGAVKNKMMEAIGFTNKIENCELTIFDSRFLGVSFQKFSVKPKDAHLAILTFSASFQPTKDEVAILAEYVNDEITIDARPSPQLDFGKPAEGDNQSDDAITASDDDLYTQAVNIVRTQNRPSISLVQRHLRIGYNRAARLLEQMEVNGVVTRNEDSYAVVAT